MISPLFMNPTYLTIVGILTFLVIISIYDENVPQYLWLRLKLAYIQLRILPIRLWYHPRNPLTGFLMRRRFEKVIKQMAKELKEERDAQLKEEE